MNDSANATFFNQLFPFLENNSIHKNFSIKLVCNQHNGENDRFDWMLMISDCLNACVDKSYGTYIHASCMRNTSKMFYKQIDEYEFELNSYFETETKHF